MFLLVENTNAKRQLASKKFDGEIRQGIKRHVSSHCHGWNKVLVQENVAREHLSIRFMYQISDICINAP